MKKLDLKQMESIEGKNCTGQNVSDCITDVYSNHGWGSVVAGLTSAFIPQTFVAFGIACAAKNGC